MARKSKLTAELIGQIETTLQSHTSIVVTCDLVGISQETFFKWLREGDVANSGLKAEFAETVKKARAMSRVVLVNQISKDPSWQAKAWILERQYPKEFGRRQLVAHAGADGESDLPLPAAATAVNLTIKMHRPDEDTPWVFKTEQDQDPTGGSEPWETDHHGFDQTPPPPESAAMPPLPTIHPPANPVQSRSPELPPRASMETIKERVREITAPPAIDTQGRPRDPDDHE